MKTSFESVEDLTKWLKRAQEAHHGQPDETWPQFYAMYITMRKRGIGERQSREYALDYARQTQTNADLVGRAISIE